MLSWRLSNTTDVDFCLEALEAPLANHRSLEIFNTDQGSLLGLDPGITSAAFTATLERAGVAISMDGRGRWMDNVFIKRLWRSLKCEDIDLKGYVDGWEARVGIAEWIDFYNSVRPHTALRDRAPMAVWHTVARAAARPTAVDMPLRLDDARASSTCPQPQQQQSLTIVA